jgi:hypothetical protein
MASVPSSAAESELTVTSPSATVTAGCKVRQVLMAEDTVQPIRFLETIRASWPERYDGRNPADRIPSARQLLDAPAVERRVALLLLLDSPPSAESQALWYWRDLVDRLLGSTDLPLTTADVSRIITRLDEPDLRRVVPLANLAAAVARVADDGQLADEARQCVLAFVNHSNEGRTGGSHEDNLVALTKAALRIDLPSVCPGEPWADTVIFDVSAMAAQPRAAWIMLFDHASKATLGKPKSDWFVIAKGRVAAIDAADASARLSVWLRRVALPRACGSDRPADFEWLVNPLNQRVLRGLAWSAAAVPTPSVSRVLTELCMTALRKLRGIGPRLPAVADAAVFALGEMRTDFAIGQLAYLRSAVKFRPTLNQIDLVMDRVGQRLKLSRDDLAELAIPSHGFGRLGLRIETIGPAGVEQRIVGDHVTTTWSDAGGRQSDVPPAGLAAAHTEQIREIEGLTVDVARVLTAQRVRLERLLADGRFWSAADWHLRYLDHPVVGTIARRLIWAVDNVPVLFDADDLASDINGDRVEIGDSSQIALWHPLGSSGAVVAAWRVRLENLNIEQPFKQAYREIYQLTEAERLTRFYSDRFAGRIVRQHLFNDLAAARGWQVKPRLAVGDRPYVPPTKLLPWYSLRAEYCVEGSATNYQTDTTKTFAFLRLLTGQVRFYWMEVAADNPDCAGAGVNEFPPFGEEGIKSPLPLDRVPAIAFSEVMRDVRMFVSLASTDCREDGSEVDPNSFA